MEKTYSILRQQEYYCLSKVQFSGEVLDIGGSTKSGYHELMHGHLRLVTGNIDASFGCDVVFDVQETFPFADGSFDGVVCLNLLEHIFDFHNAFRETARVLKPGGLFVASTPFMFQVHGSPDDYFRYTPSAHATLANQYGFEIVSSQPLGFGVFSLVYQIIGGSIPTEVLKRIARGLARGADRLLLRLSRKYRKLAARIPLGHFVILKKKDS